MEWGIAPQATNHDQATTLLQDAPAVFERLGAQWYQQICTEDLKE
jgi:hypothetical protein